MGITTFYALVQKEKSKNETALSISMDVIISRIQALKNNILKNLYKREPFAIFLSVLIIEENSAKVNAFMFPDGEIDQNFQKGEL